MIYKDYIELHIYKDGGYIKTITGEYTTFSDGAGSLLFNESDPHLFEDCKSVLVKIPSTIRVDSVYSILQQIDEFFWINQLGVMVERQLYIPYFPYARADREFDGNPIIPKRAFIDFLDLMDYDKVVTEDIHSESYNNYRSIEIKSNYIDVSGIPQLDDFISKAHKSGKEIVVCAPDSGAMDRADYFANSLSELFNIPYEVMVITCKKIRDTKTGGLLSYQLTDETLSLSDKVVVVVDDICDGGGTFILCAKALMDKGTTPEDQVLILTHGIFSKGLSELQGYFKFIYYQDVVGRYLNKE